MTDITRRSLLCGAAGLLVAFSLPRTAGASPTSVAVDSVDAYLDITPDGNVTVFAGKVDLGTGARAAIPQIVAEELGISPARILLIEGDTAWTPDQGSTGDGAGAPDRAGCGEAAAPSERSRHEGWRNRCPRKRRNGRIRRANRRRAVRPGRG